MFAVAVRTCEGFPNSVQAKLHLVTQTCHPRETTRPRDVLEKQKLPSVKGDSPGIVRARKLSRATMGNIKQNLFFAFICNVMGIPIAAGVLYPFSACYSIR